MPQFITFHEYTTNGKSMGIAQIEFQFEEDGLKFFNYMQLNSIHGRKINVEMEKKIHENKDSHAPRLTIRAGSPSKTLSKQRQSSLSSRNSNSGSYIRHDKEKYPIPGSDKDRNENLKSSKNQEKKFVMKLDEKEKSSRYERTNKDRFEKERVSDTERKKSFNTPRDKSPKTERRSRNSATEREKRSSIHKEKEYKLREYRKPSVDRNYGRRSRSRSPGDLKNSFYTKHFKEKKDDRSINNSEDGKIDLMQTSANDRSKFRKFSKR